MENVFLFTQNFNDSAIDVWKDSPTRAGIFIYSVLIPTICLCGIAGNSLCLLVLCRNDLKCSFYVYLTAIAIVDLLSCILIFLSGLARGIFWKEDGWVAYDALIGVPLAGFFSCLSSIATVFVTLDRLIYLRRPVQCCKPKFCKRKVAIMVLLGGTVSSALYIVPYCFIYELAKDGSLNTTEFYQSEFYAAYNWFDLIVFAILPLAFLSVGNTMLLLSIKNAFRMLKRCELLKGKTRKMKDQTKVTATLIAIVFFYMIGEVPTHFTNRKTAATLLFGGDDQKAKESTTLEILRQVTTLLNAFHLTIKFVLYSLFCPPFHKALKSTVLAKSARKRRLEAKNEPVKVSFMDDGSIRSNQKQIRFDLNQFRFDLNQLGFMNIFVNTKAAQELPRLL